MFYLDTSVLVPYFYPEKLSQKVDRFFNQISTPSISYWTELEFVSALSKKVREKEILQDIADEVLRQFKVQLQKNNFIQLAVATIHLTVAQNFIAQWNTSLKAPDAIHLAIAASEKLTLVTADRLLAKSARHFKIPCQLLA